MWNRGPGLRPGRSLARLRPLLSLSVFLLSPSLSFAAQDPWQELQSQKAVVAHIGIHVADVFDLTDPKEDHFLGRAANVVHIQTREGVIRRFLLFREGEPVDAALIHETERLLRALSWVRDAWVEPHREADGTLTAAVIVRDAWSLKGSLHFGHVGGDTTWRIRIDEQNFLGFGKHLLLSHEVGFERDTDEILYTDPQLFGSRWVLSAGYQSLSDGSGRSFLIERPFYELSTPWSIGVQAGRVESVESFYNRGETASSVPTTREDVALYARWTYRCRERTAWRAGVEYKAVQFLYGEPVVFAPDLLPLPPFEDRRLRGVLLFWGVSQDRYSTFQNIRFISVTEDHNLGWDTTVRFGEMARAFGGDRNAPYAEVDVRKGWRLSDEWLLLTELQGHGRKEDKGSRDCIAELETSLYNQSLPWQTLAANLDLVVGTNLDPESILYLGGKDGMRGYTNHFLAGDRRWMLSMEDRIVTPWTWWGLFRVGFVAFVDAGAVRQYEPREWSRTYADAGVGLRFGNLKGAFGRVIQVSVAVPLVRESGVDNYQIVVGSFVRF